MWECYGDARGGELARAVKAMARSHDFVGRHQCPCAAAAWYIEQGSRTDWAAASRVVDDRIIAAPSEQPQAAIDARPTNKASRLLPRNVFISNPPDLELGPQPKQLAIIVPWLEQCRSLVQYIFATQK